VRLHGAATEAVDEGESVRIAAGPRTDWFVDPGTGEVTDSAPALLRPVEGDYVLSAHVEAALASTFDAGALVVRRDERTWAKLALERSPAGEATVVSVVTRGVSDDCNSWSLDEPSVWLRIARIGDAYAFHASRDGDRWDLVRHFRLDAPDAEAGFEAQSPLGEGCVATFTSVALVGRTLADLRDGS